jgi:soluble lytic murein transglycosylase-like protein
MATKNPAYCRIAFYSACVAGFVSLMSWSTSAQANTTDPSADRANVSWATLYAQNAAPAAATPTQATSRQARRQARAVGAAATPETSSVAARVAEVAARHGVPARLAIAVARTESNLRCQARGRHGELGPMQIKPATARGLGYSGPASALNSCGAGLEWGIRHLAVAYRRCGTAAGAAALHNRGLAASCSRTAYSAAVERRMASL